MLGEEMHSCDDDDMGESCRSDYQAFSQINVGASRDGDRAWGQAGGQAEDQSVVRVSAGPARSVSGFGVEDGSASGAHSRPPASVARSETSGGAGGGNVNTSRLEPTMVGVEGFDERHYGTGIVASPLIFPSDCALEWEEYNDRLVTDKDNVFTPMRPVRAMCVNLPSTFLTKGAVKASDFITPKDESERRRVEGTARLLSMFSAAASKGYANGRHAQLEPYKSLEKKKFEEMKHSMEPFKNYVYDLVDENDPGSKASRAQMFVYACEAVYDQDGHHIITFRYWKFVFDKEYSDSHAWKKILDENAEGAHCSRMNRCSRHKRSSRVMQDSKAARNMTKTKDISDTGENLYLNLTNVSDVRAMYKTYAGTTEDSTGAPVFDERVLPGGLTTHELYACDKKERGGLHPLGPETALNAQRLPADGGIGMCPLTAGMVDLHGNLLIGHEDQMHPSKYFNEDGEVVLAKFLQEKGAFKVMVNSYQTSIFEADLPFPTCGSEEPSDKLLLLFWELQKNSNSILVTARKHARARGLDDNNWSNFREEIFRAIGQQMSERDGLSKELCRAMQQSKLCGKDSFDLSEEERLRARAVPEWCSYEARTLEPFQILKQISSEINNLYAFVRSWRFERDRYWESELNKVKENWRRTVAVEKLQNEDRRRHTELRRSAIQLALQKMQNAFESHNHRRSIPPGWLAIWDSLQEEIKRAGAEGAKLHGQRAGSMMVDPADPQSSVGSAALGQLFAIGYRDFNLNSQGMFMQLVMQLLNGEQGIQGPSTFITMAMHYAQYQVAQQMSFILAICGEGSTGKSERASLMIETQLPGWWVSGGGKSELADFNGMDDSCGRTIHLDEVTKEFTSTGPATEKIKEITMKNSCTRSRTVKKKNASGDEKWETEVTFTLHYECYVITTNCGFCLQHGNEEPSDSRAPLFDRMITLPAPPVKNVTASSKEGVQQKRHTTRGMKTTEHIIQYRIICGLTWVVLLLIKHIPDFHPGNADWAHRIMEDMDETLVSTVPNMQRSTPRKQQLRNMTLMAICVQKEVVRKFLTADGCFQHEDMQDSDGFLPPWNITQLVDVIQRLNYSPADVFEAWSHSLDYSPSTSSVSFHIRQMVAMSHGVEMDDRFPRSGTPDSPTQADDVAAHQATRRRGPPTDEALYPEEDTAPGGAGPSGLHRPQQMAAAAQQQLDLEHARAWAKQVIDGTKMYSPMSEEMAMTVGDVSRRANEMSRNRQLRCHAMQTRRDVNYEQSPGDVLSSLSAMLKTGTEQRRTPGGGLVSVSVTRCGDLEKMETEKAVGCIIPTLNDACCSGYESQILLKFLAGTSTNDTSMDRRLGTYLGDNSWNFVCIHKEPNEATAAQFNTMWRYIKPEKKGEEKKSAGDGSAWREAARVITKGGSDACNVGKYGMHIGITESNLRDALWMLSTCKDTLIGRNSNRVFVDVGNPGAPNSDAVCTAPYGAMRGEITPGVPEWNRAPPVVCTEAKDGKRVRAFGADMWHKDRPDVAASMRFVADKPLDVYGKKEELVVRRFQKLFQVGGLPACNPFSIGAVETGSMIRMDRGEMHVNSLSIIQHMRLFMEISYFLASHPETRNKSGISRSKMPSTLVWTAGKKSNESVSVRRDAPIVCESPEAGAGGGMRASLMRPTHGTATVGFEPDTEGDKAVETLCHNRVNNTIGGVQQEAIENEEGGGNEEATQVDEVLNTDRVQNLGFGFEMFTLWATIKMSQRWSNDCDEHVHGVVDGFEHLLGSAEKVLSQMPKFTTKFCAFSDMEAPHRSSEDEVVHTPISIDLPRRSTYVKELPNINRFGCKEIWKIRNDLQCFMQRDVDDAAMHQELNSKLKAIGGIPGVRGNLWAWSTWYRASCNDLISRGQAHGGENDHDLFWMRDSDLDVGLRKFALFAKRNGDDPYVKAVIGSREGVGYKNSRHPTPKQMAMTKEVLEGIKADDDRDHKRQCLAVKASFGDVAPAAVGAFTAKLSSQAGRKRAAEAEESGFDPMSHELPPQQGV